MQVTNATQIQPGNIITHKNVKWYVFKVNEKSILVSKQNCLLAWRDKQKGVTLKEFAITYDIQKISYVDVHISEDEMQRVLPQNKPKKKRVFSQSTMAILQDHIDAIIGKKSSIKNYHAPIEVDANERIHIVLQNMQQNLLLLRWQGKGLYFYNPQLDKLKKFDKKLHKQENSVLWTNVDIL